MEQGAQAGVVWAKPLLTKRRGPLSDCHRLAVLTGLIELRNLTLQRFDVIGRLGASSACREDIANRKGRTTRTAITETSPIASLSCREPRQWASAYGGRRGGAMTTAGDNLQGSDARRDSPAAMHAGAVNRRLGCAGDHLCPRYRYRFEGFARQRIIHRQHTATLSCSPNRLACVVGEGARMKASISLILLLLGGCAFAERLLVPEQASHRVVQPAADVRPKTQLVKQAKPWPAAKVSTTEPDLPPWRIPARKPQGSWNRP